MINHVTGSYSDLSENLPVPCRNTSGVGSPRRSMLRLAQTRQERVLAETRTPWEGSKMKHSQLGAALAFFSLILFGATLHAIPDMYDSPAGYSGGGDDDAPSKSLEATARQDDLV